MRRLIKAAALGLLFLFSTQPFEAKATAASLFTGKSLLPPPSDGIALSRPRLAPMHRPARLARSAMPRPAPAEAAAPSAPLPSAPRFSSSRLAPPGLFAEASRRTRQRGERAPPAGTE